MQTLKGSLTRMRGPLSVLAAGAAGSVLLLFVDPNKPGNLLPKCPFKALTGLDCPGCGVTRMIHALLHGDVVAAWHFNAVLLVLGVPLVAWLLTRWTIGRWKGERRPVPTSVGFAVLAVTVVWGVGRNIAGV